MKDIFSVVTGRIIAQLEKGVVPWRRTWSSNGPTSYQTNKEYQGINALILQDTYESPYWLTFRQAQKLGGSVRAGEKGSPIVFVDRMAQEKQKADGTVEVSFRRFLKYYTVFNWEQTRGLPEKVPAGRDNATNPQAEELMHRREPVIKYHEAAAFFRPGDDSIYLPNIDQFESSGEYYSAAFHELTHWTGGRGRLERREIIEYRQEKEYRSLEELTAEMGAAFLCRMCALDSPETFENQAAYVQSWLKVFKGDTKIVMQSSKQARAAVEFILSGQKVIKAEAGATATA